VSFPTGEHPVDLEPLAAALPADCLLTDPDRMANYRWDRAYDPDAGVPLLAPAGILNPGRAGPARGSYASCSTSPGASGSVLRSSGGQGARPSAGRPNPP
jgi:hypothetical protein